MEEFKQLFKSPVALITIVAAFIIGAIIGLVVLGWWIFPVEWSDAAPVDLRADAKVAYLRSCIDAYGYNGDAAKAKACYESLGETAGQALAEIVQNPGTQDRKLVAAYGSLALATAGGLPAGIAEAPTVEAGMPAVGETVQPLPGEEPSSKGSSWGTTLLIIILVVGLLGAAAFLVLALLRRNQPMSPAPKGQPQTRESQIVRPPNQDETPISQALATYHMGDDLFDEVYSIESGGEFLGEYGVAIVDSSGVAGPKKVNAFEIWLFDKNDPTTTTKVLMSEQAFNDPAKRKSLEAKGEPKSVDEVNNKYNGVLSLTTKTLRLEARILEVEYGQGSVGNYFDRLGLELTVWQL